MSSLELRSRSLGPLEQQSSNTTTTTNIDVIATLDHLLYRRYEKAVAAGAVILRADLVAWALAVKAEVDPEGNLKNFKPDSGWMEHFMERHQIDLEAQLTSW